ncbi:MAG TPA: fasciclin domain-containing protein [Beijerinckia sp.]|nr:fasciclin domain-containing protein [Beijerinckia sp.]
MKPIRIAALAAAMSFVALGGIAFSLAHHSAHAAEMTVEVGGAPMYPSKNIIENAVNSKDHTTLVAAVKAAGLVETLQGDGPFTVFAPTNEAFVKLPKGTVEQLLQPENKAALTNILTYHVIAGKYSAEALMKAVKDGGGKAAFKTVEGEELTVTQDGRKLEIVDAKGGKSFVTIADINQKNGVIHVVDTVLLPKG